MEIVSFEKIDMALHGQATLCHVYCIHAKVTKIYECAQEMITVISDRSWIDKLDTISQVAFKAKAEPTITKLVNNIGSRQLKLV